MQVKTATTPSNKSKPKKGTKRRFKHAKKKPKMTADPREQLEKRILEGAPDPGSNPATATPPTDGWGYVGAESFEDLPISDPTKKGLTDAGYVSMTVIQRATIPHSLAGQDILGAAKTGSGKTLSFLIPVLDVLYRRHWCSLDGLGGLIISPTKELASQIFEELRNVGRHHELSAGLLIGGRNVENEKSTVDKMNLLVATPGRLLQHMDETYGFDASSLQVLVLDEADRILDMGFEKTLNAILENLPADRQTFLYSATQTKSIKDLARLSLSDPEYISVHAESESATPSKLNQFFVTCELEDKMTVLWSFVRSHLYQKTIVFLSTCKQVRFVYEVFRRLKPGVPLGGLGGHMKLNSRMNMFTRFCEAKSMVLFATDVASRGLDFPKVDWVLQVDCPENVDTYIHRVGRTARYVSGGQGLLMLLPSEKGMLAVLEGKKIPIKRLKMRPSKLQTPTPAIKSLVAKFPDIKSCAQRALVNYVKSVSFQSDKEVFQVANLDICAFASSLGLDSVPNSRALKKMITKAENKKAKSEAFKRKGKSVDDDVKKIFESDAVTGDVRRKRQKKDASEDLPILDSHQEFPSSDGNLSSLPPKSLLDAESADAPSRNQSGASSEPFVIDDDNPSSPANYGHQLPSSDDLSIESLSDSGDDQEIVDSHGALVEKRNPTQAMDIKDQETLALHLLQSQC